MNVEPIGMPAPMKAWRAREREPVTRLRCGAGPGCNTEVGAVYRSAQGLVVESRISVPEQPRQTPPSLDLAELTGELGITGVLDGVDPPDASVEETVRAQVDLLNSALYWQDPVPLCPRHGQLRIDRAELAEAVQSGRETYEAAPLQT